MRGQPRFLLAVDHPDAQPGFPQDFLAEIGTIACIPDRRRGHGCELRQAHAARQMLETTQRIQGAYATFRVEMTCIGHSRAQGAHDFFVVEISR